MADLDRQGWLTMHAAIFGRTTWANGELLRVTGATPGKKDFGNRGVVAASDAAGAWDIIERCTARGQNTYISIGVQDASAASATGRGKKTDIAAMPALVVDLDIRSGVHSAGDRNPTLDEVDEWIADYPLGPPTVTVHTGGGLHAWYVFDTPIDPFSDEGADALARHKAWWAARAAKADRNIDEGVLADIARVLRPAGSRNFKAEPLPVVLRSQTDNHITVADLVAKLPAVEQKRMGIKAAPRDRAVRVATRDISEGARASDRFALAVDVESLCDVVFGAHRTSRDGLSMPDSDANVLDRDAGRLFIGDAGEQRVTWFSTTVQAGFDLDSSEHNHSSFDVLAHGIGGGRTGYRRAGKLVEAWEGHWDTDEFVTVCQASLSPACREAFAVDAPNQVPEPPQRPSVDRTAPVVDLQIIAPVIVVEAPQDATDDTGMVMPAAVVETLQDEPGDTQSVIASALSAIFASATEAPPVATSLGPVTVETGGGTMRVQYAQNRHLNDALTAFHLAGRSHLSGRRSVGSGVFEMLGLQPADADELATALTAEGFVVEISSRDAATDGCQIRCSRSPLTSVEGVQWCERHRDEQSEANRLRGADVA